MATYRRNPQTAGRVIDGQVFVVTPDDNKLHTLNEAATSIWTLAAGGVTSAGAAAALCAEFDVDEDTARADAERCLADLAARKILLVEP